MRAYLENLRKERNIILPECYKLFYMQCAKKVPLNLIGTDLFNSYPHLNEDAVDILKENGIDNFLEPDDFVFMMHQGYVFCYFKANGDIDPLVHTFQEGKAFDLTKGEAFSEFIREFLD